ncbi:transcription factor WhiB [Catenulispora acidiphila DSM 44928]|uniref:Transcriptional regulator WhiB n=1 Tax=Catenulispora acidiphila (strain DSM 44928 / JCM 14897 / NBRC 102108 / NRRL B-24433 / ID139908) TaxID=479433 RepID=C7QB19_CATAD|nr:WhiB family transcriptional regulator [Catenulispora acidiphila]ACU76310.1 transcription factor WhiB [Catenulispora acidiphila DSM 44928]
MNGSGPRPIATLWEWQESAACRSADSARFFSPTGERGFARSERERLARELCDVCPVREECARFALAIGEEHGIWGGTTSQERIAQLRRPRGGRSRADIAAARGREAAVPQAEAA